MEMFTKDKETSIDEIGRYILKDSHISSKAKGLFFTILYLSGKENVSINTIQNFVSDGQRSVESGLKELKKFGYLEMIKVRYSNGKIAEFKYIIHTNPINVH